MTKTTPETAAVAVIKTVSRMAPSKVSMFGAPRLLKLSLLIENRVPRSEMGAAQLFQATGEMIVTYVD